MFKAGDTVRIKYSPKEKLFILEVVKQTCYAGVEQVWYCGRLFRTATYTGGIGSDMQKFSAIEVESIPESSSVMKELGNKLEKAIAEKQAAIEKQDWEAATKCRHEEKQIRSKIALIDEEVL